MPASTRVWAKLRLQVHNYFFRYVLAGEHSAKQDITAYFYEALYNECLRRGIAAQWSPSNMEAVRTILNELNFNERSTDSPPTEHQAQPHDSKHEPGGTDYSSHYPA